VATVDTPLVVGRHGPGQRGQAVQHLLGEARVGNVVLEKQYFVFRRFIANGSQRSNKMSLKYKASFVNMDLAGAYNTFRKLNPP
jgi:hypothetical protein